MDLAKLIERARKILLEPRAEWSVIASESPSVGGLHTIYLLILAAIPAVLQFLKLSVAGTSVIASGLTSMLLGFALSLATMYVMAWIVDALAPRFSSKKNPAQSRKTVAYAYTASLVASIAIFAPGLWMVAIGVAAMYAIYLLYLGLPATMNCPREKAASYAAVTVVIAVLLGLITSSAVNEIVAIGYDHDDSNVTAVKGSPKRSFFQTYLSSPDPVVAKSAATPQPTNTPTQPVVEALAPEQLKPFVPESLLGRERTNVSVERVKEMGVETSRATAYFTDDLGRTVELQVTDLGRAKSTVGLSSFVNVEEGENEAGSSFEKTYRDGDDLVTEKWNDNTSSGEYSVLMANRFVVKVQGQAYNIDELKAVTAELDLATLEGMVGGAD